MLAGLIRQFDSGFQPPSQGRTFDTDQSAYRKCDKETLPFYDRQLVEAFDGRVRDDFSSVLVSMADYASYYLHSESMEKMQWLGQALFTLLEKDTGSDGDLFFYCDGGISKEQLLSQEHIFIPALLLAMWHYVLMNRPNNKLGRPTYEAWYRMQGEKGDRWTFVSDIGKDYNRNTTFDFESDEDSLGAESYVNDQQETGEDPIEPEIMEETTEQDGIKELHQTVMINNGPGPQIKEHHGDIVININ